MVFALVSSAITSVAAFLFPIFASYKAIKANDNSQLVPWLMFWCVQGCLLFLEHWLYLFLQWIPLYKESKMLFTLWMVMPQTQGASYLYLHYVHPHIAQHERDLDGLLIALHEQIKNRGGQYVELIVAKLYELFFGPTHHVAARAMSRAGQGNTEQDSPTSREGFISALFSRFRTVPVGDHPDTIPASLISFLGTSGRRGPDIIPANLSPDERARYVNQQKAKLQEWLYMLEAAEKAYPPMNLTPSGSGSPSSQRGSRAAGQGSGSRTPTSTADSDYEDLGRDETLRTSKPASRSSSWFWKNRTD